MSIGLPEMARTMPGTWVGDRWIEARIDNLLQYQL